MSKFQDKVEQFYMEGFGKMFKAEEKQAKDKEEIKKAMKSKKNDEAIFESVLLGIADQAEKTKKILFNEEDEEGESFDVEATPSDEVVDADDEPIEDTEDIPEDEKDEMDKADEILQDIDLTVIDNSTRVELIRNIIDSAQNYTDEDDMSFDDFVQTAKEVFDEFQYEEEGEGEESSEEELEDDYSGEEAVEETGEEETTEEEPMEETEEEPA